MAATLDDRLVGVYLHGSLAMGCYYRPKSDVDLLVVCAGGLPSGTRREVARRLLAASGRRPTVGDLEASIIGLSGAQRFTHPSPYEVHFGTNLAQAVREDRFDFSVDRTDPDLAAHCTVIRQRGVRLRGAGIAEVFGPVPPGAYLAAIDDDLAWILEGERILGSPYYGVLNACRVLMVRGHGHHLVPTKEEAGVWAIGYAPAAHLPLIGRCLDCYRSGATVTGEERPTHGHNWDERALLAFRDWCRRWA